MLYLPEREIMTQGSALSTYTQKTGAAAHVEAGQPPSPPRPRAAQTVLCQPRIVSSSINNAATTS
jgi:hypothetical protein